MSSVGWEGGGGHLKKDLRAPSFWFAQQLRTGHFVRVLLRAVVAVWLV
jgi:hypothetical protein